MIFFFLNTFAAEQVRYDLFSKCSGLQYMTLLRVQQGRQRSLEPFLASFLSRNPLVRVLRLDCKSLAQCGQLNRVPGILLYVNHKFYQFEGKKDVKALEQFVLKKEGRQIVNRQASISNFIAFTAREFNLTGFGKLTLVCGLFFFPVYIAGNLLIRWR